MGYDYGGNYRYGFVVDDGTDIFFGEIELGASGSGDDHTLVIQEALHAHAADATTVYPDISAADALHAHAADVAGLGVTVTIAEALHAHAADNVELDEVHILVIAEALHAPRC